MLTTATSDSLFPSFLMEFLSRDLPEAGMVQCLPPFASSSLPSLIPPCMTNLPFFFHRLIWLQDMADPVGTDDDASHGERWLYVLPNIDNPQEQRTTTIRSRHGCNLHRNRPSWHCGNLCSLPSTNYVNGNDLSHCLHIFHCRSPCCNAAGIAAIA